MRPTALFPLVLLLSAASARAQDSTSFEGKTVTRIDFDPPLARQPLTAEEIQRRLSVHAGMPLTVAGVRTTIENLYLTGRYSDISVDAEPDGGGVTLRIATEFNYFISGVNVAGESEPPNKAQITAATKLELGSLFENDGLDQAEKNVEEVLRANGFYSASVETHVDRRPATEEANIYFFTNTGDRAHFDGVTFLGETNRDLNSLIHATGWRRRFLFITFPGWRELTQSRLQNGIGEVQDALQKGDRLLARATLEELQFHPDTDRVTPVLRIDLGPIIQVKVTGAKVSNSQLRKLVPIYQERTLDRDLLMEGQRNLLGYFQSRGYYDASVDFKQSTPQPARTLIDYSVMRGIKHRLVHIEISGNRYFETETLRDRLSIVPASFPRYRWGKFSQKMLDRDKDSIESLYRSNGFRDVKVVVPPPQDGYKGVRGNLAVSFRIEEGPQWRVNMLEIDGMADSDLQVLRPMLASVAGQPFSQANVGADRDAILTYYFNDGYADATFDWAEMPGPIANTVNLRYTIEPGKRLFVRSVLVRGLNATRASLVADRISLNPGDPLSQLKIINSQQRLYELGIFSKVQTAIQNPDGDEDSKYVLFHMDEASKYSLNAGIGAQLGRIGGGTTTFDDPAGATTFSPRLSLGLTRLNLFGLAHTAGIQTLFSTFEQRVLTTYSIPQFAGNDNLSLSVSGLFDASNDIRTFTAHRLEGSLQVAQRLSRAETIQYRYTYRRVTIPEDTLKIEPLLIPLLSQPDRAGSLGVSFIQDRRDNPTDSTRGFLNTADVGWAAGFLGSATDFGRLQLRNATYHRLSRNLVLARQFQFGYIQRFAGGVALPPGTPSWQMIPLAERLFSGGASTQRAFPENQAGPRDPVTGFPLGGDAYLLFSTELRFPLIGDNVGGVLFHDMGNVYSSVRNISLRFWQNNNQDFDYAVHAFGFGIRYRTPIGPIRVDLSLSPDSPRFVGFSGTRDQLLSGTGTPNVPQRINIFQFHFSLGQTF